MEISPQAPRQVVDFASDVDCAAKRLSALVVGICRWEFPLANVGENPCVIK
jgi:hypothetical protein